MVLHLVVFVVVVAVGRGCGRSGGPIDLLFCSPSSFVSSAEAAWRPGQERLRSLHLGCEAPGSAGVSEWTWGQRVGGLTSSPDLIQQTDGVICKNG